MILLKLACLLRTADAIHLDGRRAPGFLRALRKPEGYADLHWTFQQNIHQPAREGERIVFTSGYAFTVEEAPVELAHQYGFANLELLENVLTIESGVPGISNIASTCHDEQWITMASHHSPFHSQSLEGLVIEAAAKAWKCSLTEVINASDTDKRNGKFIIGYSSGHPLIVRADVIRNPLQLNDNQANA